MADCGDGTWGDIPVDANTIYVDDDSSSASPNGSSTDPFATITDAVAAASDGDLIAVAAGSYDGPITVSKDITIWGRCPAMVDVSSPGGSCFAVSAAGDGATLRGMALGNATRGVYVNSGATDVTLEQLHFTTTTNECVRARGYQTTTLVVQDCLVEDTRGFFLEGASVTIRRTEVRDTAIFPGRLFGVGVVAQADPDGPASVAVEQSVFSNVVGIGVYACGGNVTLSDSVVRGSQVATDDVTGGGVHAQPCGPYPEGTPVQPATLRVERSFISDNENHGAVALNADLVIEDTVVRNTLPNTSGWSGNIVVARTSDATYPGSLALRRSVIAETPHDGLAVLGQPATVEQVLVYDTGLVDGTAVTVHAVSGERGTLTLSDSALIDNRAGAVVVLGSDLSVSHSRIDHVAPHPTAGDLGMGIYAAAPADAEDVGPTVSIERSQIAFTHGVGVAVLGGHLDMLQSEVLDTALDAALLNPGAGIGAQASAVLPATADIRAVRVERAAGLGALFNGAAPLTIDGLVVSDTAVASDAEADLDAASGRGIQLNHYYVPTDATLRHVLVERAREHGILANDSRALIEEAAVVDTLESHGGLYGDGIIARNVDANAPTVVHIVRTVIQRTVRAAVSSFGAAVTLEDVRFRCQSLDLNGQSFFGNDYSFHDGGQVWCGCSAATSACRLLTAELTAPEPLGPAGGNVDPPGGSP